MELRLLSPLTSFERELQSMLDRAFGRAGPSTELTVRPSMDVSHDEGMLTVEVELPGLTAEDLDISVDGDMLVISGEKQRTREMEEGRWSVTERTFGRFERRVTLPEGIDVDAIEAHFEGGVLRIEVPVTANEPSEARHIPVKVG